MKRAGIADLPLHGGRVPPWLALRMERLGTAISESVIHHYGVNEFLTRLSDPFWFQAFGAVMGMDWNSSGITTSVLGALKRGINPRAHELGVYFCGGRGRSSRNTPAELLKVAERHGLDGNSLVRTSRLTARIDNNAVGDGFQVYLHSFVVTTRGDWMVVQQGLNDSTGMARRYHWHSASVRDFVDEPHTAIVGHNTGTIVNLVDSKAKPIQAALLETCATRPDKIIEAARHLTMPSHHDVRIEDVDLRRLGAVLAVCYDRQLHDFASLLLTEKLGPRTLQTLALIAETIHGTPARFHDPARFSFALGGKDGHPFPVPLKVYDDALSVLRRGLDSAKVGHTEKVDGWKRLDALVRRVESECHPRANFERVLARERAMSPALGGRTVMDDKRPPSSQMALFESLAAKS